MFVDPSLAAAKQRFLSNVVPSLDESLGLINESGLVFKEGSCHNLWLGKESSERLHVW
jgi:hypothetical protein